MATKTGTVAAGQSVTVGAAGVGRAIFTTTGSYSVDYPLGSAQGKLAISASTTRQALQVEGGLMRLWSHTGTLTYTITDDSDAQDPNAVGNGRAVAQAQGEQAVWAAAPLPQTGAVGRLQTLYQNPDDGAISAWNPQANAFLPLSYGDVVLAPGVASAVSNTELINAAAAKGLANILGEQGTVFVQGPILLPDNSQLIVGSGTTVKAAPGRYQPLVMSKHAGVLHSASLMIRSANVVTVQETQTWRKVGDRLFINGGPTASFRGLVTITAVTANSYSYASAGADGVAGTVTQYYNVIPVRRTLAGSAFVVVSNGYVNVTDPGHNLNAGDNVYLGQDGGSLFAPGVVQVVRVDTNRWTYLAPGAVGTGTGTIALSYDKNISLEGAGLLDGDRATNLFDPGNDARLAVVHFGCVTGPKFNSRIRGSKLRGVQAHNCASAWVGPAFQANDSLCAVQFEGGVAGCVVDMATLQNSNLEGEFPPAVAVTSLTRGGAGNLTAIVVTATPHGLTNGNPISWSGAVPAEYNTSFAQVVVVSPTQFNYQMASAPAGNASTIGTYTAGQIVDDCVAFTGTKFANGAAGNYDSLISPYGLTFFSGIELRRVLACNALNAIKLTADVSCPFVGPVKIGSVSVVSLDPYLLKNPGAAIRMQDDGPGLQGTKVDAIYVDGPIEFTGATQGTATAVQLEGAGTLGTLSIRGAFGRTGVTAAVHITGVTTQQIIYDGSWIPTQGFNKPSFQFLGGTIRNFMLRNCRTTVGPNSPCIYLSGSTVNRIVVDNVEVDDSGAGSGNLILWELASGLESLTLRNITTPVGGDTLNSVFSVGNLAMGTVFVTVEDCDVNAASFITTPGGANTGTMTVYLVGKVRWTPTGGGNFMQTGGSGAVYNVFGGDGVVIPDDKLALFGFGTPTYRLSVASQTARVNMNAGNYVGGQMAPVAGDILYNSNAGVLIVGKVIRRAAAWAML